MNIPRLASGLAERHRLVETEDHVVDEGHPSLRQEVVEEARACGRQYRVVEARHLRLDREVRALEAEATV